MDPILYWNNIALAANRIDYTKVMSLREQPGPVLGSRALAIVHLAMYDAFVGASAVGTPTGYDPYLPASMLPVALPGASVDAAVAAAAHASLVRLYPSQKATFDASLGQAGLVPPGLSEGYDFGLKVADRLWFIRQYDPGAGDLGFPISLDPGCHRVDPDNPTQGFHARYYGAGSRCFAATTRHTLDPHPGLGTTDYLNSLAQVRDKGQDVSATRTADETEIGIFWAYDGAINIGTPPRLYNQIVRDVAQNIPNSGGALNTPAENARLFALVNAAMGDAGILSWEDKYNYNFWRPIVGIRDTVDPTWLPLGAPSTNAPTVPMITKNFTPNFPAYPSGHATFGSAAFHSTRLFYGVSSGDRSPDNLFAGRSFVSDELNGINRDNQGNVRPAAPRSYPDGLWQMIVENAWSRIFLGVHWSFDAFAVDSTGVPDLSQNVGGVPLGLTIAEDIHTNGLMAANAA